MRTLLLLAAVAAITLAACTDIAGQVTAADAATDGTTLQVPGDGGTSSDAGEGGGAIASTLRVANLSPDLGAVDVCIRAAGSSAFRGPLFAPSAPGNVSADASFDASISGVPPATVSEYVKTSGSGTFELELVAAGDLSCARPIALGEVTIDAGKWVTIVVMGSAGPDAGSALALRFAAFPDDATQDATSARVRFINAALDLPALRGSIASGASSVDVAAAVDPGHAAAESDSPPKVDALGYGTIAPAADPASLALFASGTSFKTAPSTLGVVARSVHTAIVFRESVSADDGGSGVATAIAWCSDIGGDCVVLR